MTYYNVGTASVTEDTTTITFAGAGLGSVEFPTIQSGDMFLDLAQPLVPAQRLANVDYVAQTATLAVGWPGTTMVAAPYEIRFTDDAIRRTAQQRRYLELLGQLESLGIQPNAFGELSDRDAYDDEARGFIFLSLDGDGITGVWTLYIKETAATGDWDGGQEVEGVAGPQGNPGLIGDWIGPWVAGTYPALSAVSHGGTSYIANIETSTEPPHADWDVVAAKGDPGNDGDDGSDGVGVVAGGSIGQVLKKASATDYDTEWADEAGGPFSADVQGTGRFGLDDVGGIFNYEAVSAAASGPGAAFRSQVAYSYTGGTPGIVNSADWHYASAAAGIADFIWTVVGVLDNSATAGENVAIYGQGNKLSGAGPTWAGVMEARDKSGDANPTTALVGLEIDVFANGGDANNRRVGIDIVAGKGIVGTKADVGYGIRLSPQDGDTANAQFKIGLSFAGEYSVAAIDLRDATLTKALWFDDSQELVLDTAGARSLRYAGGSLAYKASGADVFLVSDIGGITSGALTASSAATNVLASLTYSNDGAGFGPQVRYVRESASPAASDGLGGFQFIGRSSTAASVTYADVLASIVSPTNGATQGQLQFRTDTNGTALARLTLQSGVQVGAPTGGDKGAGTLNATAVYDDNTLLTCMALQSEFLDSGDVDLEKWDALVPDLVLPERREIVPVSFNVVDVQQVAIVEPGEDGRLVRRVVEQAVVRERHMVWADPVYDEAGNIVDAVETPIFDEVIIPAEVVVREHGTARLFKAMLEEGFDPRNPSSYIAKLKADQALPGMPTRSTWRHNGLSSGEMFGRLWLATEMLAIVVMNHEERLVRAGV